MTRRDAAGILDEVGRVYSTCSTYLDRGERHLQPEGRPNRLQRVFSTRFTREVEFAFRVEDATSGPPHEWTRKEAILHGAEMWAPTEERREQVVMTSAKYFVPMLLLPDFPYVAGRLPEASTAKLVEREPVSEHECHILVDEPDPYHTRSFAIDAETFLIRRIVSDHKKGSLAYQLRDHPEIHAHLRSMLTQDPEDVRTTTTYEPEASF